MAQRYDTSTLRELLTRREFVTGASAAVLLSGGGLAAGPAAARPRTRVNPDDPMARALSYVHDAKTVDAALRSSSTFCNNCALFAGAVEDEWAGCRIFPGKDVASGGWCSAWAAKQAQE